MPECDQLPPSIPTYVRVIDDYQAGRLSLEAAAKQFVAAMQATPQASFNIGMTPSVRRLMAEVNRIAGGPPVSFRPDPNRHARGGRDLLKELEREAWQAVAHHPRANEPLSIGCHFAAATEATARALVSWLETRGNHHVKLQSPVEADTDDWIISAHTPPTRWSRPAMAQWAAWIREAPLGADASFTGWGV